MRERDRERERERNRERKREKERERERVCIRKIFVHRARDGEILNIKSLMCRQY